MIAQGFCNGDRAVSASRASYRYGQAEFSLFDIHGDQKLDHVLELFHEFPGLPVGEDVFGHRPVQSGQLPQIVHIVRIRQESDVKDKANRANSRFWSIPSVRPEVFTM